LSSTRYGQGYKLDLRLEPAARNGSARASEVVSFLQAACPGAKLEENEPPCLTLTVPQQGQTLSYVFRRLAEARSPLGVLE